jgi:hypothetical protein
VRHPSARVLRNRVDLYRFVPVQDSNAFDLGDDTAYTTLISAGVACSVQPGDPETVYDAQGRPSAVRGYHLVFAADPGLAQRDRVVWVDGLGVTRRLHAAGPATDQAGRSGAFRVRATERV